ncbi:hypothetical protein [Streptomyces sp. WMMC940]|uniref:hypothetical protein n=1 Tax=Streptomyces sp. WMMC940 TaxID=3015153 RepID=UPI0022B5F223|nr:hypothetical protein [Streptomyces sp. WMMC940]MCZ7457407.1 hypothetical protein [Streptomyces sp. WMMC940]
MLCCTTTREPLFDGGLVPGHARPAAGCPQLFTSVDTAWDDLAVAAAVLSAGTTEEGRET